MQGLLENCCFDFLQQYLPRESLAHGWTCPEAVELHKAFWFLIRQKKKLWSQSQPIQKIIVTIRKWRHVIPSIRHAAVHRTWQDSAALLKMCRAAVLFTRSLGSFKSSNSLLKLCHFLQDQLAQLDFQTVQLECRIRNLTSLHHKSLSQLTSRQLALLPEAARRILQRYDEDSTSKIERYLHESFFQVGCFVGLD
jgi:hypothetical protein